MTAVVGQEGRSGSANVFYHCLWVMGEFGLGGRLEKMKQGLEHSSANGVHPETRGSLLSPTVIGINYR